MTASTGSPCLNIAPALAALPASCPDLAAGVVAVSGETTNRVWSLRESWGAPEHEEAHDSARSLLSSFWPTHKSVAGSKKLSRRGRIYIAAPGICCEASANNRRGLRTRVSDSTRRNGFSTTQHEVFHSYHMVGIGDGDSCFRCPCPTGQDACRQHLLQKPLEENRVAEIRCRGSKELSRCRYMFEDEALTSGNEDSSVR